jgi:hypothetical protein
MKESYNKKASLIEAFLLYDMFYGMKIITCLACSELE